MGNAGTNGAYGPLSGSELFHVQVRSAASPSSSIKVKFSEPDPSCFTCVMSEVSKSFELLLLLLGFLLGSIFEMCTYWSNNYQTPPTFVTWLHPSKAPRQNYMATILGLRYQAYRPLLIIYCLGLLHQI